jgi:hypothetical protein
MQTRHKRLSPLDRPAMQELLALVNHLLSCLSCKPLPISSYESRAACGTDRHVPPSFGIPRPMDSERANWPPLVYGAREGKIDKPFTPLLCWLSGQRLARPLRLNLRISPLWIRNPQILSIFLFLSGSSHDAGDVWLGRSGDCQNHCRLRALL